MAVKVRRGNDVMAVRDNNQLTAFLNNGWALEAEKSKATRKKAESTEETKETAEEPKKPVARKRTTTRKAR